MAVTKENMKENNNIAIAKLNNCPTSPRKMRIGQKIIWIISMKPQQLYLLQLEPFQ